MEAGERRLHCGRLAGWTPQVHGRGCPLAVGSRKRSWRVKKSKAQPVGAGRRACDHGAEMDAGGSKTLTLHVGQASRPARSRLGRAGWLVVSVGNVAPAVLP